MGNRITNQLYNQKSAAAIDWRVTFVSVIRTVRQAKSDDPVLERLLLEAEDNLQWDFLYNTERIKILPQGLWFMKKTLYRRIQVVAGYLHALKNRHLREGMPTHCIPVTIIIELVLQPTKSVDFSEIVDVLSPTAIPYCTEFKFDEVRKELMRYITYSDLKWLRVLLKMHIRAPILKSTRAVGEGIVEYDSDDEIVVGSEEWMEKQTEIKYHDAAMVYRTRRSTVAHIEVVLVKPISEEDE